MAAHALTVEILIETAHRRELACQAFAAQPLLVLACYLIMNRVFKEEALEY